MNDIIENTIEELQLDRSKWKLTKFGDIAIQQKGKVNRENTNLTRYIKGEHMGSEDIHIRDWGELTDEYLGPAFIRKFEKGDILYGSRRTYLRKVSIADFDGITSNTTFVIKANEDKIDKRILPFIMMSEGFTENSIKNSKGSVNPYINWKDIAKYEFLLPPKDQQAKLAELLWAMDEVIENENEVLEKLKVFKEVRMINLLNGYNLSQNKEIIPNGWKLLKIKELGIVNTSGVNKKLKEDEKEINLLNYMDVYSSIDKKIDSRIDYMKVTANANQLIKNQISIGDVLFTPSSETADDIGHSAVVTENLPNTLHSYHLVRLKFKTEMDLNFKRFVFNNPKILYNFSRKAKGVTRMTLSLDDFNETEIRVPPIENQKRIANELSLIVDNILSTECKISSSKALQKSLINQVF
jgi:restriction endonuclease S subunit